MTTCVRCGATLPDGAADCPACREREELEAIARVGDGERVDLRRRVMDDRGMIKRLQASIPGWREYRDREDLRIADSLLRTQLADRFDRAILPSVEEARRVAAARLDLEAAAAIGSLAGEARSTGALVRHAEQGYSGISAPYAVDAADLSRLYDYDCGLVAAVRRLERDAALVPAAAREDAPGVADACRRVEAGLGEIRSLVAERRAAMARIGALS